MAIQITPATVEQLGSKLEAFSATLTDEERTLFKNMVEGRGLSEAELNKVVGGATFSMATQFAPKLSRRFFQDLMCW